MGRDPLQSLSKRLRELKKQVNTGLTKELAKATNRQIAICYRYKRTPAGDPWPTPLYRTGRLRHSLNAQPAPRYRVAVYMIYYGQYHLKRFLPGKRDHSWDEVLQRAADRFFERFLKEDV